MKQLLLLRTLFSKNRAAAPIFQKPMPSLGFCLVMDILGCAFVMIPFVGPFLEMLFAPISAFIYFRTFGGAKGIFGGVFNFIEELIPGIDFIPTFTITWALRYANRKKETMTIIKPATR